MKRLFFLMICLPIISYAQYSSNIDSNAANRGIRFEEELNWVQILEKAKAENKYIFIDCYTTWCGPCKQMDKEIYPQKDVGDTVNEKFISVKIQMDTTKRDNEQTKSWYNVANLLMIKYDIDAFPTYLFFAPDGRIVHKGVGTKSKGDFLSLIANATDPYRQYYTLLEQYERKGLPYKEMAYLAFASKEFGKSELANRIAKDYIDNYLNVLDERDFIKKENLEFVDAFSTALNSKDKIFNWYLHNPRALDSIIEINSYAQRVVERIITMEEIKPALEKSKAKGLEPKWEKISRAIDEKYGRDRREQLILTTKVNWYYSKENWEKYTESLVMLVQNYVLKTLLPEDMSGTYLNNYAWNVFQYSNNKQALQKALSWIDLGISYVSKPEFALIDTKANLLYKLGRKEEAIILEAQALDLVYALERENGKEKGTYAKPFIENFEKMKQGEPTWVNKN